MTLRTVDLRTLHMGESSMRVWRLRINGTVLSHPRGWRTQAVRHRGYRRRSSGPKRAALMSDQFCRLSEITTCWRKNADGTVGAQVDCPDHLLGSARNSAVLNGCHRVHLDSGGSCAFITKEMLKALKKP